MTLKQRTQAKGVRQFGHPRGLAGRAAGWVMAHRPSNRQRNVWVVSMLDVQPAEHVLEVGFGPGVAIAELARRVTEGRVYGVDHSARMVRQATRRNAAAIRDRRVELIRAPVEQLPSFDRPLDAIMTVNSIGFWPDPATRLRHLRQLLRAGGRIALASQPRSIGATKDTTEQAARELHALLIGAGFGDIRTHILDLDPPVACVIATNGPA